MVDSVAVRDRVVANGPAVDALVAVQETLVVLAVAAIQALVVEIILVVAARDLEANALVVAHVQAGVRTSVGAVAVSILAVADAVNHSRTEHT